MFITIHCGGLPFNGNTIKERSLGGSETAAYYMAKELANDGNNVTIFTNDINEGVFDNVRYVYAGQPSEATPFGDRFHQYAENTPVDVLIIQRSPTAFNTNFPAKIKLLWLHDLASSQQKDYIQQSLFYVDGILTVSKMHKEQVVEAWGVNPDIVYPIQNGVDLSLFEDNNGHEVRAHEIFRPVYSDQFKLLYTSRPERGLEHLVMPDGIMDQLAKERPEAHLYVCGYDNTTPQMEGYYNQLWQLCEELPNVTLLGALTKQELADVMRQCDLHVYPTPSSLTPDFKEVSCITVMECAAAGLPMLTSNVGALPETANGAGVQLIDLKDGLPNIDKFVEYIVNIEQDTLDYLSGKQLKKAPSYAWPVAATKVKRIVKDIFAKSSDTSKVKELIHLSDIQAAQYLLDKIKQTRALNEIELGCEKELKDCYGFFFDDYFDTHYKAMYEREEERGVHYGAESMNGNPRFETVAMQIANLPEGAVVLDYGCAHGHYTINLAKRFPDKRFIGVDITESNVIKARDWAKDEAIDNVEFYHGRVDINSGIIINKALANVKEVNGDNYEEGLSLPNLDAVIAAEVIEHVAHPVEHVDVLATYLKDKGTMIITTPYGGWEAIGYKEHWPWRAHIHHFERADLHDIWGDMPEFRILCVPSGQDNKGYHIGSYVTCFTINAVYSKGKAIDYERKINTMLPKETISLCMIVKDGEDVLRRSLDSVKDDVDEVIIALDKTTTDRTREVIANFIEDNNLWPVVTVKDIDTPTVIGFDAARNESIKDACGDWIMWLDGDEVISYADHIRAYVQHNQYNGYALKQHHISAEPLGVLKTDYPVRLFRRGKGIKFNGVVHEHPEIKMNEGVGHAVIIPDVDIMHHGYTNEVIRRARFDRNINLMARDREENPDRVLGKFLWMRDIAQMTRYELQAGAQINDTMKERCKEGIRMFEELLETNQLRMLADGMEWYSICAGVLGAKFQVAFTLDTGDVHDEFKPQGKTISAMFLTKDHATKLFNALLNEKVKDYEKTH